MKTSNKLLLALLAGFLIAALANNLFVKVQYQRLVEDSQVKEHKTH